MITRMGNGYWALAVVVGMLGRTAVGAEALLEPPALAEKMQTFSLSWEAVGAGLTSSEQRVARAVFDQLEGQSVPGVPEVEGLERLVGDRPRHAALRLLAELALFRLAGAEATLKDHDGALEHLRRAVDLDPAWAAPRLMRIDLLLQQGEWSQAEHEARDILARDAEAELAALGLSYALLRQDRDREALEVLDAVPRLAENPAARRLYERLKENLAAEERLRAERLWRFSLRYDGEQHDALGDSVLGLLDEQYARLAAAFLHTPSEPIPVVLLSREAYSNDARAPGWSGGFYSSFDGRIRVPTGGLSSASVLELDGALTHELTHAFVDSVSRGRADWELQEGLAQHFEGQRSTAMRDQRQAGAAEGDEAERRKRYVAALTWVEYLMEQGGQAGINTLLSALGRTGDPAAAYREAFGRDLAELREGWQSARQ
jgi:hypothetical protein